MARLLWRFLLRLQIARVNYWRFRSVESPVVYTGDLKSQQKSPVKPLQRTHCYIPQFPQVLT